MVSIEPARLSAKAYHGGHGKHTENTEARRGLRRQSLVNGTPAKSQVNALRAFRGSVSSLVKLLPGIEPGRLFAKALTRRTRRKIRRTGRASQDRAGQFSVNGTPPKSQGQCTSCFSGVQL